jgi:hypothetical protein
MAGGRLRRALGDIRSKIAATFALPRFTIQSASGFPMRPVIGGWTCPLMVSYVATYSSSSESGKAWSLSILESSGYPDDIVLVFDRHARGLLRPPSGGMSAFRSSTRDGPSLSYGLADDVRDMTTTAAVAGHHLFVGTTPVGARARPLRMQARSKIDHNNVLAAADVVGLSHEMGLPLDLNLLALSSLDPGGVTRLSGVVRVKMIDLCELYWPAWMSDGNLIARACHAMCERLDAIP